MYGYQPMQLLAVGHAWTELPADMLPLARAVLLVEVGMGERVGQGRAGVRACACAFVWWAGGGGGNI